MFKLFLSILISNNFVNGIPTPEYDSDCDYYPEDPGCGGPKVDHCGYPLPEEVEEGQDTLDENYGKLYTANVLFHS